MRTALALALLSLAAATHAADPSPPKEAGARSTQQPNVNSGPQTADGEKEAAGNDQAAADKTPAAGSQPPAASRQPATAGRRATDRLDLDTTVVTGNRELPKVLYIVPWKKADIGDLPAQPFNTLLDEALTPVDRDVFRREVTYYGAVSVGAIAPGTVADSPAAGPEK